MTTLATGTLVLSSCELFLTACDIAIPMCADIDICRLPNSRVNAPHRLKFDISGTRMGTLRFGSCSGSWIAIAICIVRGFRAPHVRPEPAIEAWAASYHHGYTNMIPVSERAHLFYEECGRILLPIAVSMVPQKASHVGLGAPFKAFFVPPISLTRTMATAIQTQPRQNRPPMLAFCSSGIWSLQIKPTGRNMTAIFGRLVRLARSSDADARAYLGDP